MPTASKMMVATKSPLTGLWLDSYAGGHLGPEIKYAGYDGIVVEDQADEPLYVLVSNDRVEFRDASMLWGMTCPEAEKSIRRCDGGQGSRL